MIEIKNVKKSFSDICAVNDVSFDITEGTVYGLIGTNGAGKSTLLRIMSGVIKADSGCVMVDGENVYENPKMKQQFFYLSDEQYFFNDANMITMIDYYANLYPNFNKVRCYELLRQFQLEPKRKIKKLSKGMKKQVSFILGICANTKYLFCDETFDGLDPVVRQAIKSIFAKEISERDFTPVIASHNLRELEDISDSIGLLHRGGILLSKDLMDLKIDIHKIQFTVEGSRTVDEILHDLKILTRKQQGKLATVMVRGSEQGLIARMKEERPAYYEILPLSLEEIFICETEAVGYDVSKIIS